MILFCAVLIATLMLMETAARAQASSTTQTLMLTGSGKDDPVMWNFECTGSTGQNLGIQTTIGVPSQWELQGFGTYNYGLDSPQSSNVGQYSYTFNVPTSWAGNDVQLVFEGVMTDCTPTINGQSTGYLITLDGAQAGPTHQGGFTQFRYDVTSILNYGGSNTIAVTVAQSSANASVNGAEREGDYWNFGGIYRPVYLECRPSQSIQRVAINALASGTLTATVALNSIGTGDTLTASVQALAGQQVGPSFSAALTAGETSVTLTGTIPGITPWNPENPSLYQLALQLKSGSTLIHTITQKFGFRTVQLIVGQGIYINGVKVRLKGVCKHTFWPTSGRTSSPSLSASAVAMLQAANINAVRMSHYPPDQHFLDACDAGGIMVLDELPGWQQAYDNATAARMVSEMVPRDVNHPSVIMWDNGNEGGWNTTVDGSFDLYDPQDRPVHHPGQNFNNINDVHYPSYSQLQSELAGTEIVLPTEFQHAQYDGGGGAGMQDQLSIIEASSVGAGGFIWEWGDEGVVRTDEGGYIDTAAAYISGGGGAKGIVGPYWQPEPSYYALRDIWSPVTVPVSPIASGSTVLSSTFNGQIGLHNDYFFTSLSACTFTWQIEDFPLISSGTSTGPIVSSSGSLTGPAIAPQTSGALQLNLPAGWSSHGALQLTAYNSSGQLLTTWTWPIQSQSAMESANLPAATGGATAVTTGTSIVLSGSTTDVTISKTTGLISAVEANSVPVSFNGGPALAAGTGAFSSISLAQNGSNQVVTANFTGNLETITYTMRGDGWMKVDYTFSLTGSDSYIGVQFNYPAANVLGLRWFGNGPEPVWQNRLAGVSYSVWSKTNQDEASGISWANAPVFEGYHSNLQWASIQTSEQPINIIFETPGLYLGFLTPETGPNANETVFAYPSGSISSLEAIAAIGNKFESPSLTNIGPSSGEATATGPYEGDFWINFGSYNTVGDVNDVWAGGGADSNWETLNNWSGGHNPPLAGDVLSFAGAANATSANNFPAFTSFDSLTFTNTAGSYTVSGNPITLTNNAINDSPNPETIGLGMAGSAGITQSAAGTLALAGSNSFTGATVLSTGTLEWVANAGNTSNGVCLAPGETAVDQSAGTTLSLIGNTNGVTFLPQSCLGWANQKTGTYYLYVGNNGSGTGNTLVLGDVVEARGGITPTYTLTGADGYTLQIGSGITGNGPIPFDDNELYNSNTPGVTLSIPGGLECNYNGGFTLTFGGAGNIILGPIPQPTGTIALALNSAGTITLTGANTFTNGTTLSAGTLALDSDTALGTGALNIGGGTALDATLPGIVQTNNNAQSWDGNFTFDGTYSLNLGAGAVTLTGNRTVTVNANTLTVGGPISGGYGITKAGAGTLLLSGRSTYSGATSVSNGVLEVSGSVSSTSSVTVSAGGVFYLANGSLSVSGGVTNNGIFKLFGTTALSLTGPFINNGVLDLINGTQSLPPNFTNNGTVLDASSVQVRQLGMTGSNFSVTIQGYAQHTYQLQRSITLAAPVTWTNVGPPQTGAGSPLTFTDNGGATALQGFYQVQVSP